MNFPVDNGILLTNLEANHFNIRNLQSLHTSNIVEINDSRLSDPRHVLDGSVTNESVSFDAAITQDKLLLNGDIPSNFTGTDAAARGDLVQPLSAKGQPNGYASLSITGKLPSGSVPLSGTGTVHDVTLDLPIGEFTLLPASAGTTRSFSGDWAAQSLETWLGNISGASASPTFGSEPMSVALIPNFDANKIGSETFTVDQLPVVQGVGAGHAPGLLPDPGPLSSSAQTDDYFARDGTFKPMKPVVSNQPTLPEPSITVQSYYLTGAYVNITTSISGANMFYRIDSDPFVEIINLTTLPLLVPVGSMVSTYIAKVGYNNSDIAIYTVPPIPAG